MRESGPGTEEPRRPWLARSVYGGAADRTVPGTGPVAPSTGNPVLDLRAGVGAATATLTPKGLVAPNNRGHLNKWPLATPF